MFRKQEVGGEAGVGGEGERIGRGVGRGCMDKEEGEGRGRVEIKGQGRKMGVIGEEGGKGGRVEMEKRRPL